MPSSRSRWNRGCSTCSTPIISIALVVSLLICGSYGGWIDPDTPGEAYKAWAIEPVVPKKENAKESVKHHHKHHHDNFKLTDDNLPTPTPTEEPTAEPTNTPTLAPTPQPTTPWIEREYDLVFSDEFNTPGRTFEDGSDPKWTSIEKNDYTNDAQHYYAASNVFTNANGELVLRTEAADTDIVGFNDVKRKNIHDTKHFRSGMLQGWNKFCFTGGIVETEVTLPGKHNVGGLWPAFWILGNLARHTYVGSSEHIWPWASTVCTEKGKGAQLINGCQKVGHFGLEPGVGRGAPEIDIFEVQPGETPGNHGKFLISPVGQPFMSASYQVAPGKPNRIGGGYWPAPGQWYDGLAGGNNSVTNIFFYGAYNHFLSDTNPATQDYWGDAISYNRQLAKEHFQTKHKYRLEWDLPKDNVTDGYLHWFLNDELVFKINGTGIVDAGLGSEISTEPSYLILNTAISSQWGKQEIRLYAFQPRILLCIYSTSLTRNRLLTIFHYFYSIGFPAKCPEGCPGKKFDCHSTDWKETCCFSEGFCDMMDKMDVDYKVNYVRVYQDKNDPAQKVGCSTPERPTRQWIEGHEDLYKLSGDKAPLKKIQRGGGSCNLDNRNSGAKVCGGEERGTCKGFKQSKRVCECAGNWTGPTCLVPIGFDDTIWDPKSSLNDLGYHHPTIPIDLVLLLAVIGVGICLASTCKHRLDGFTPIPDAVGKG